MARAVCFQAFGNIFHIVQWVDSQARIANRAIMNLLPIILNFKLRANYWINDSNRIRALLQLTAKKERYWFSIKTLCKEEGTITISCRRNKVLLGLKEKGHSWCLSWPIPGWKPKHNFGNSVSFGFAANAVDAASILAPMGKSKFPTTSKTLHVARLLGLLCSNPEKVCWIESMWKCYSDNHGKL